MRRLNHGGAVFAGDAPAAGEAAYTVIGHILSSQNGHDAWRVQRSLSVDAANSGMR